MSNTIGRFYFKLTINGNLLGEYSNNLETKIFTECAEIKPNLNTENSKDNFIGNYDVCWLENGKANKLELEITHKLATGKKVYTLHWKNGSSIFFWGEGMRIDETTLIGDYRNYQ